MGQRFLRQILMTVIFFIACASQAQAFSLRLSQQDLNQMIGAAFPQTQQYQGIEAVFTEPFLELGVANQLKVEVTLTANRGEQRVKARAAFDGTLDYSGEKRTLQVIEPRMTDFEVIEHNLKQDAHLLEQVKQLKNKPAPMILLLDLKDLDIPFLGNQMPKSVSIRDHKLLIEF